ncbi:MAG TPA: hypothetical protein VLJ58_16605 [Ramlibacter sp.]|nr:hypothetical protein [Ramlibacter sp.]
MHIPLFSSVLLGMALCLAPAARAQAPAPGGNIEFKNVAEVETEVKGPDGKFEKKRGPVEKVVPGMVVAYTSTFKNIGTRPAGNIAINNPVPANTTLVPGSTYGDNTEITYSADGGKTWATAARVMVRSADGKDRPAGISEFTHVRWTLRGELAPGKQAEVGFRVVVN